MIAFTGSTAVGSHIMKLAADSLKKVNLETSGIDPFIVCEDADLDVAAQGAVWSRFLNAGQVCTSAKRFYVVEEIAKEFSEKFVAFTKTLKIGDPLDSKTDIGPLISREALEKVERQIRTALQEGAKLLYGGKRLKRAGYFLEPTVLGDVRQEMTLVREEVFGPVAALVVTRDIDEAIRLADDSPYGLGASIYTTNLSYVMKAMEGIKAGTFWVNDPLTDNDAGPFGGMRQSGIGRELGEEGLDTFRETKHVHIDYIQEVKPYWYPYRRRPWQLEKE